MDTHKIIKGLLLLLVIHALVGCAAMKNSTSADPSISDDYSSTTPQELQTITDKDIRMQLLWDAPQGEGPFPTIIVHPGRGETIFELSDILSTLADNGFVAVAAGYQRRNQEKFNKTLLPWRTLDDARRVIDVVRANPMVDGERIGTLGFSLGGAHSLLLAAGSDEVKTAVVYYPMSDFPTWLEEKSRSNIFWRMMMSMWQSKFKSERSPDSTETMEGLLAFYSPINHTRKIDIPLLIIHGDKDRTTPLAHSVSLNQQLIDDGNEQTNLMIMDNASHAFNFRSRGYEEATAEGWKATLNWLSYHLDPDSNFNVALQESELVAGGS